MSASALLSLMTGGALNGASNAPVSDARMDGAADMGVTGFASFSRLLDAEGRTVEASENGEVSTTDPVLAYAYAPLVQGLPLTFAAANARIGDASATVDADASLSGNTDAAPALEASGFADTEQSAAPFANSDAIDTETPMVPPVSDAAQSLAAPVTAIALVQNAATGQPETVSDGASTTIKAADLLAARMAQANSIGDETADAPVAEDDPVLNAAKAEAAARTLEAARLQPQSSAQLTQSPSANLQAQIAQLSQAKSHIAATKAADAETLEVAPTDSAALQSTTEANNIIAKPGVAQDNAAKTPVAQADTALAATSRDAAPLDVEVQSHETAELAEAQTQAPESSRLSRATVETTAQIAASILRKLETRTTRFDMVLTPEQLGSVDVSMEIDADGHMTARLAFDNPAAANEMRARSEELRRQLMEAGFQLTENALEFTDRESNPRGGFQQFMSDERSNRRAFAGANRLAESADAPTLPVWTPVTLSPSGVDMKV